MRKCLYTCFFLFILIIVCSGNLVLGASNIEPRHPADGATGITPNDFYIKFYSEREGSGLTDIDVKVWKEGESIGIFEALNSQSFSSGTLTVNLPQSDFKPETNYQWQVQIWDWNYNRNNWVLLHESEKYSFTTMEAPPYYSPEAKMNFPDSVNVGEEFTLNACNSKLYPYGERAPPAYWFKVGEKTKTTPGSDCSTNFVMHRPGDYEVKLTVIDGRGNRDILTDTIRVGLSELQYTFDCHPEIIADIHNEEGKCCCWQHNHIYDVGTEITRIQGYGASGPKPKEGGSSATTYLQVFTDGKWKTLKKMMMPSDRKDPMGFDVSVDVPATKFRLRSTIGTIDLSYGIVTTKNPITCTEGGTKCSGYGFYECQNEQWELREKNSKRCGYINHPPEVESLTYSGSTAPEETITFKCKARDPNDRSDIRHVGLWIGKCNKHSRGWCGWNVSDYKPWDLENVSMNYNSSTGYYEYKWKIPYSEGTVIGGTCQAYDSEGESCVSGENWCGDNYPLFTIQKITTTTTIPVLSTPIRVFVTSTEYRGDLGGLSGADAKCQERADAAGLGGRWRAWLSKHYSLFQSIHAKDRIPDTSVGYYRLDGVKIADDKNDLTDWGIKNPIEITEYGTKVQGALFVWTGTKGDGTATGPHCSGWKSSAKWWGSGTVGKIGPTSTRWTEDKLGPSRCFPERRLYCFEVNSSSGKSMTTTTQATTTQKQCFQREEFSHSSDANCCSGLELKEDLWSTDQNQLFVCCYPSECSDDGTCEQPGTTYENWNKKCQNGEWVPIEETTTVSPQPTTTQPTTSTQPTTTQPTTSIQPHCSQLTFPNLVEGKQLVYECLPYQGETLQGGELYTYEGETYYLSEYDRWGSEDQTYSCPQGQHCFYKKVDPDSVEKEFYCENQTYPELYQGKEVVYRCLDYQDGKLTRGDEYSYQGQTYYLSNHDAWGQSVIKYSCPSGQHCFYKLVKP